MTIVNPLDGVDLLSLITFFGPKVIIAALCGAIIGVEREIKHKNAGVTTMLIMCVGSALFVATTVLLSNQQAVNHLSSAIYDPARVIAQIVSGIGFICGGVIFKVSDRVSGITTAAMIWTSTAVGILVGVGAGLFAIILSVSLVSMILLTKYIEKRFMKKSKHTPS